MALRFYATSLFPSDVKDGLSRIIDDVSWIISEYADHFINFFSDDAEKIHIMQKYYKLFKFPNVLGYIDGRPSKNEHLFVNRKCFHSIKVSRVCGADLKFKNIVAKWLRWLVCE